MRLPVGAVCEIHSTNPADPQPPVLAEVVGFAGDRAFLMPTGDVHGNDPDVVRPVVEAFEARGQVSVRVAGTVRSMPSVTALNVPLPVSNNKAPVVAVSVPPLMVPPNMWISPMPVVKSRLVATVMRPVKFVVPLPSWAKPAPIAAPAKLPPSVNVLPVFDAIEPLLLQLLVKLTTPPPFAVMLPPARLLKFWIVIASAAPTVIAALLSMMRAVDG